MGKIEIYAAEKRMSLVLEKKFEMQKELHALLCGEQKEIIEEYTDIFDVMDNAIIQEAQIIERQKKGHLRADPFNKPFKTSREIIRN